DRRPAPEPVSRPRILARGADRGPHPPLRRRGAPRSDPLAPVPRLSIPGGAEDYTQDARGPGPPPRLAGAQQGPRRGAVRYQQNALGPSLLPHRARLRVRAVIRPHRPRAPGPLSFPTADMTTPASVSVVIPTFNHAPYLGPAILSALNQSCPP